MPRATKGKVVLAMSGGVDSSVAAVLLLKAGYDVVGCFMRLGSEDEPEEATSAPACAANAAADARKPKLHHQGCCSVNDAGDARLVAAMLDIPFYVLNFRKDFGRIKDYFAAEYNAGRTPNPCVRCNDWLKFGKLWGYAKSVDADFVATGHYARVDENGPASARRLLRGIDHSKDQSYVLFGTRPAALGHMLLPVGDFEKPAIRQMAQDWNLPVFDKPDSQEICFVPDNDYARLVTQHTPGQVRPGTVLDRAGQVVGQHQGHQHFTIGQRRGVGVALGYPIYVVEKNAATNTVTVGSKEDLLCAGLEADQTNWLVDIPVGEPRHCDVKIRYNGQAYPATVSLTGPDAFHVAFDQPQGAVSPGQAVVCYDGDVVLGGGWITRALQLG